MVMMPMIMAVLMVGVGPLGVHNTAPEKKKQKKK